MKHLMVDIETLGTHDCAPVLSIGAVFFDPSTGESGAEFSETISLESSMRAGAKPDASTIVWWLQQSDAARRVAFSASHDLREVLERFSAFCRLNAPDDFQFWGNGPSFDATILRNAYRSIDLPTPWNFWNERDVRTLVELGRVMGIDPKHSHMLDGIPHNAIHDARFQVMYVSIIWKELTNPL